MIKPKTSPELLILGVSIYLTITANFTFWQKLTSSLDLFSIHGFGYLVTTFCIILFINLFLLTLFSHKYLLKPALVFFLCLCLVISYFTLQLGVVFDREMIRNIVENLTDHNVNEALDLISFPLLLYVFVVGSLPLLLIVYIKPGQDTPLKAFTKRGTMLACIFIFTASTFVVNYKFFTFFFRQNEEMLVYVTPAYALVSVKKYFKKRIKNNYVFKEIGDDAQEVKQTDRKIVGIMVIGETARADHFSLNGYGRTTNPLLSGNNNVSYFNNVHSCGTSTAFSVPCMFSFLNQEEYSPEKALRSSNVLDVIKKSRIDVVWVENNSSCKRVCDRIRMVDYVTKPDEDSEYFVDKQYVDEVMLAAFDDSINNTDSDILLVLHSIGSHGPKYYNRFPERAAVYKPYCKKASPQECTREEIINAYDNTILYTDYFLDRIISYLKGHEDEYESFMMYVSDHGESLGEMGTYLHGLPNFLAPQAQTHVPLLMWFSDEYLADYKVGLESLKNLQHHEYTHDNLPHTLLGIFNVKTDLYDIKLDIINQAKLHENITTRIAALNHKKF